MPPARSSALAAGCTGSPHDTSITDTLILLTGIHAVGSNGVIHYLTRELADLYEQVGTRRFSTLIASEFDPATRTITSSRRITPLYLHEDA